MADKPKDRVVSGENADGEFICVYGMDEHKPAPLPDINYQDLAKCEVLPPLGGLATLMQAAEGRAPKDVTPRKSTFPDEEPMTFFECIVVGFVAALIIAWTLLRILALFIAACVATVLIGVAIAYLTGYWHP